MQSFSDINIKGIRIDKDVGLKDNHGVLLKLVQANGKPVVYQTPLMALAWNAQVRVQEKGQTTCNLAMSFGSTNKDIVEFRSWLTALRDHIKALVRPNVAAWYGSPLSDTQIDDYLAPIIKEPLPDSGYSAVFLPKMAHEEGKLGGHIITIKAFAIDRSEMDIEMALKRGNRVGAIIKVPYIHVGKGNKQLSIRSDVTQCLVLPNASDEAFSFNIDADPALQAAAKEAAQEKKRCAEIMQQREEEDNINDKKPKMQQHEISPLEKRIVSGMAEYDGADDV